MKGLGIVISFFVYGSMLTAMESKEIDHLNKEKQSSQKLIEEGARWCSVHSISEGHSCDCAQQLRKQGLATASFIVKFIEHVKLEEALAMQDKNTHVIAYYDSHGRLIKMYRENGEKEELLEWAKQRLPKKIYITPDSTYRLLD